MSKQMTAVAVLALVAGTAMAAPRESLNGPATLNVNGASLASETFNLNFTGSDGGGAYQATRVRMTGTLTSNQTNTWPNDTSMDVTPPGGAAVTMLVSPIQGAYVTQAVDMNAPLGSQVNPAGSWLFDVYDTIEDGDGTTAEAILSDIVVTLDDQGVVQGETQATAIDLGTLVDGTNVSTEVVVDPAGVKWYKFVTGDCSAGAGRKLSIGTLNSTMGGDSEFAIWLQDGSAGWLNDDYTGLLSFLSFGVGSTIGVDLPAGEKFVCVGSYNTNFFLNFVVNTTGPGGTFQLDVLQEFLGAPTAPTAEDLGTLVDGTLVTRNAVVDPAAVLWYKATVADCNATTGRTLQVTTMNGVDANDTEIGVYTAPGALVATNDDFGGTLHSELSFGANGISGDLTAGLHYIAVSTFNANFLGTGWNVTSTGPGGDFQLDVLQSVSAAPIAWDETTNGGGDAGNTVETAQIVAGSGPIDRITGTFEGTDFDVFVISICDATAFSATTQFSPNNPDTQLFLFDAAGMPVEFNDDAAGIGYSRIDATYVTGTGNYLLCLSRYDNDPIDAGGNEFWLDAPFAGVRAPDGPGVGNALAGNNGANVTAGSYRIDLTGACFSGPAGPCSAADVGMAGGEPGQDNLLDNNDFIAFINFFFAQNSIADQGQAGGEYGSDGLYDNNDFIAFINHFFEDAANCNG